MVQGTHAPLSAANLSTLLFARAAPEDVAGFSPQTLAALVSDAQSFLARPRRIGSPAVRVFNPDEAAFPQLADLTIIEAVNDDMPFLLDSTLAELADAGLDIRLVVHPVLPVTRDATGSLQAGPAPGHNESLIHIHIARMETESARARLAQVLARIFVDVRVCVADWQAMRARVEAAASAWRTSPPPLRVDEIGEAVQFLDWLAANNFILLGVREYRFEAAGDGGLPKFDAVEGSGLGILRDPEARVLRRGREFVTLSPEVLEFLQDNHALMVTKANIKSRVHRRTQMDYVGVKLFAKNGQLEGELRILGLFTANIYTQSTNSIPYIRHKVARVLEVSALQANSHSGKALANVLESYPRDELFQIDLANLTDFAGQIASLSERPRLRVLARPDRFDRFVSVLAFLPRDRYDTRVRMEVGRYLAHAFQGRVSAVYPFYPDGPLVRVHFILGRDEGVTPVVPRELLEAEVAKIIRTWADALKDALLAGHVPEARMLAAHYGPAFSGGYTDVFEPQAALADIAVLERMGPELPRAVVVYRPAGAGPERLDLKVFSRGRAMPLSERVPVLEHMGFRVVSEQTFDIKGRHAEDEVWLLHDMSLVRAGGEPVDLATAPRIEAALTAVFDGEAESDGYNALILASALNWRDIARLRTLSRYLRQIRVAFSQDYMWETLVRNAAIAALLVALIDARFDPAQGEGREAAQAQILSQIDEALAKVTSLDEDRILRRFLNLVQAAVRTNFWQRDAGGQPRPTISFKFESHRVEGMPLPRPLYEITVYCPRVEGIHLRFGKVARGGLRWSDRPQDFRTEILGLVKAQQVKNAVIVPVGAKGGFVPKFLPPPAQRDAWMAEGIASYKIFINALLDLTDNLEGTTLVPPPDTVRHDGDDPYLVVAADKGTATFSDIANGLSQEHHHWLGDAFASGGSVGYDHKKMGITARGAWEAVKRHFREMDKDIQTQPFTVAGVGDMSGDVFGNGMLLSPEIRLVAAFDHRDIFLDPNPDPAKSLAERARMFNLPRSSWQDYDRGLISEGGGIFPRGAKEIVLSPQAQAAIGLAKDRAAPAEILSAILKAPVDLLWFGGIGTYIRASAEGDEAAGDRANDAIRITGAELRCKVMGEGANLGATQRGRIEAALAGVRLNTDAIDNSAGVNTSDVEVNIKIALSEPVRTGVLDPDGRVALLASMTGEVGLLVLRNNYQQTLALSLAQSRGTEDMDYARRFMQKLEKEGRLDRAVEFLPDNAALNARARAGQGLTRPELAVLLAYAKLTLNEDLLASDVPDDPYLARELARYFPAQLRELYPQALAGHRLRREIVATALANALVNRGGPTVLVRISDETGAGPAQVTRAFAAVRDAFGLTEINNAIDALDTKTTGSLQLQLYGEVQALLLSRMIWFIRNADFAPGLEAVTSRFRNGVQSLAKALHAGAFTSAQSGVAVRVTALSAAGVPVELAQILAILPRLAAAPDIVMVAEAAGEDSAMVAATFFAADEALGLGALLEASKTIVAGDHYDLMAINRAVSQIEIARRRLAGEVVSARAGEPGEAAVTHWLELRDADGTLRQSLAGINAGALTLSRLSVAAGLLGDLAG